MDRSFLLQTKFLVPRYGTELISRPDLLGRLQTAVAKRLTLLSAPPGYGKTTLLAELSEQIDMPYAWYQLDAVDGDPTIFLSYLIACARQLEASFFPDQVPTLGQTVVSLLDDSQPPSPERILAVFINELAATLPDDYLFILEDYHLITNPDVHRLVNLLLDSGPPQLHLVISSRTDPPLGLGRLRARGRLAEFRATELRFRAEAVQHWLDQAVPGTAVETARLLNEKTEGWAAALQIILSSLTGKDVQTADQFIAELTGTQRFIFEYLAEEVFQQHTPERQQFLTKTAVLDQMNAAVCNALLDCQDAQITLESLEKDNLFIVSLDAQREWYRYHHLFREFLLGKLRRESTDELLELEEQAGSYYRAAGELEAAFAHFVRAKQLDTAAEILTLFARGYVERGRFAVLQRYLGDLPDEVVRQHPELLLQHGNVLWRLGRSGTAVARYEDARAAYLKQGNQVGVCRVLTQLAELARSQGDYRRAHELATEALAVVPTQDHAHRAKALMALAKSEGFLTGMDRGHELGLEAVTSARLAGDTLSRRDRANLLRSLGHISWWYGEPEATLRHCQEALSLVSEESPIAASVYITMATPYVYRQAFATARQYAERGLAIAEQLHLPELLPRAHSNLGSILSRVGESEAGERHLRRAVELAQGLGLESYSRVMAVGYLAQNLCNQGRIDEARQLAEAILWEQAANPNTYEMVVTRSVLADIALESGNLDEAQLIFESLEEISERRQFRIPLAMVYFGLAYVHGRNGRLERALPYAEKTVAILEPLGTWQLFLDQGERARTVCRMLKEAGTNTPFVDQVLARLGGAPAIELEDRETAVAIKCLGEFQVFVNDQEITQAHWVSTKARDMLAYFVTERHKHVPLEKATVDIWPEQGHQGRAFHSALYRLRQAMRQGDEKTKFVIVKGGECWLDTALCTIDADEFETAINEAIRAAQPEAELCRRKAISLYSGEFMSNLLYYDWANNERQRLQNMFLLILKEQAKSYVQNNNFHEALDVILRAIQHDPLRENYYCLAMACYAGLKDRGALIRSYQTLTQELREAFDLPPSLETRQRYEQLLATI